MELPASTPTRQSYSPERVALNLWVESAGPWWVLCGQSLVMTTGMPGPQTRDTWRECEAGHRPVLPRGHRKDGAATSLGPQGACGLAP